MTPAILVVIMLTANPGQDMKAEIPMDSLKDCQTIANLLKAPGPFGGQLFPKILFAGCAIKKSQPESKIDYRIEQGV